MRDRVRGEDMMVQVEAILKEKRIQISSSTTVT